MFRSTFPGHRSAAPSASTTKAQFKVAWLAFKESTDRRSWAKAYAGMNLRNEP